MLHGQNAETAFKCFGFVARCIFHCTLSLIAHAHLTEFLRLHLLSSHVQQSARHAYSGLSLPALSFPAQYVRSGRRPDKPLQDSNPATKLGSLDRRYIDQSCLLVHPFSSYLQHAAHHGYLSLPALSIPAQYLQDGRPFVQTAPGQPFGHEPPFIDRGSFEQSYCSKVVTVVVVVVTDAAFFLMYA